ncbi:DUF3231 family protein [Bacillus sp. Marseille-Q1617]|uniref:DUF3231 family protein n=1 Tax=Bacillus sp. Marseille-Q1617 TaxID=2736887 RepID=UPI0020CA83BC|nr:DUF3231 family protein [Bacillus sp. Marseille-Q1617]
MSDAINNMPFGDLTVNEVSNLWSSYLKNSMDRRLFEYLHVSTENDEIKQVIGKLLNQSQVNIKELEEVFIQENLTIPLGFTDKDVNVNAPKVFSDTFILYICFDTTHLSMSTYPSALSDCTKKKIRDHFQKNIEFTVEVQNEIVQIMLSQGVYLRPPQIEIDSEVEFADSMIYLNGFLGASRSLNTAEIANLSRIIHRAQFSKMVFVTFSQFAKAKEVKKHFGKGRDQIDKVLHQLQEILDKENIPVSASGDYKMSNIGISPFSDKLMLFFVNTCLGIFCFNMVNQAMTSSLRTDIILKLGKISDDMKKFYGLGLLLAIKEKWFEEPPQAVSRKV